MHSPKPEFDLPKLVRELEEILAMVNADHNGSAFAECVEEVAVLPVRENDAIVAEPGATLDDDRPEPEKHCEPVSEGVQRDERDRLYDDALVVMTEFGQASPVILQMWLSIDYGRATKILSQFQTDGLVSSKGRVRHKAYAIVSLVRKSLPGI